MVLQFGTSFEHFEMARLARPSQDAQAKTKISKPIKVQGQRNSQRKAERRQSRPTGLRWIQRIGWAAAVATLLSPSYDGHHPTWGNSYQDEQCLYAERPGHGPSTSRIASTLEEHGSRNFTGGGKVPHPEGRKHCPDDQNGFTANGGCAEGHNTSESGAGTAVRYLEEVSRADRSGVRDPACEVSRKTVQYQGGTQESGGGLPRSEEDSTGSYAARRRNCADCGRVARCRYGTNRSWNDRGLPQEENCREESYGREDRPAGEEASTTSGGSLGRGGEAAFSLGRYPSRHADGDDRRPRFFQITEEVYYDEMAPIHDDHIVTIPACLNVGSQQSLELHRHHEQVPNTTYFANQAHYVALLMHHEVVAQEVPEEQLSVASPFHEDYWDDYLTVLEATRIEEQRQALQGRSPPFDEGTEVTVASPGESDPGADPLSASTLTSAANRSRVEIEDCLNWVGTFADHYIKHNVDDLKYDLFPVETYGFVNEEEYGETYGFVDEEEYGNRLHGNDFEKRIAHAVETSPACALAAEIAVFPKKRRDHSAGQDHYITVELDTDTPDYFVVKTLAKSFPSEDINRFFCIDERKIWRYTGKTTIPALRGRLLDERQSATELQRQAAQDEGDVAEGPPALDEPMLIIDEWEELRLLLANGQQTDGSEVVLVMYGLFQNSLGTRRTTAEPTIEDVRNRAMEAWQEFFRPGTVAYLHLVRPQQNPTGRELHLIIEFSNRFFDVPAVDTPVARKIYWEGVWTEAEPVAAYHTRGISTFQLLIQSGLMEWCGPNYSTLGTHRAEQRLHAGDFYTFWRS